MKEFLAFVNSMLYSSILSIWLFYSNRFLAMKDFGMPIKEASEIAFNTAVGYGTIGAIIIYLYILRDRSKSVIDK